MIQHTYFHTNIGIGEYRLSAITFILTLVIGIGQNFHIGASLDESKEEKTDSNTANLQRYTDCPVDWCKCECHSLCPFENRERGREKRGC